MSMDSANLHILWRDSKRRLDDFSQAVREGRHLDEAASFARFVMFSVCGLLVDHPQKFPLTVDGPMLRAQAEGLLSEIQTRYRAAKTPAAVDLSEVQAIHRKLDLIAGHLARSAPMSPTLIFPALPIRSEPSRNDCHAMHGDGGVDAPPGGRAS
jgi:hypothetical protein